MNHYLISNSIFYKIIVAKNEVEAWAEVVAKKDELKDLFFDREDVRQFLIQNNFKNLTQTKIKNVFKLKK